MRIYWTLVSAIPSYRCVETGEPSWIVLKWALMPADQIHRKLTFPARHLPKRVASFFCLCLSPERPSVCGARETVREAFQQERPDLFLCLRSSSFARFRTAGNRDQGIFIGGLTWRRQTSFIPT